MVEQRTKEALHPNGTVCREVLSRHLIPNDAVEAIAGTGRWNGPEGERNILESFELMWGKQF